MRIAVIGAGPAGIAAGHELLKQGFDDFTIYEKAAKAGGTWHQQTYPGLACDVWAHSYTFSYAPNPNWSANFVYQSEIERYLQRCLIDFGLEPYVSFNTEVKSLDYQSDKTWLLKDSNGQATIFDVVINCMGNQHTPLYPNVDGIECFKGPSWHSTQWRHDVDLSNKKVLVVGSAASAVQIVPEIAEQVGQLWVLQRTPNWIMPRRYQPYSKARIALNHRFPSIIKFSKSMQKALMSLVYDATTLGHKRMEQFEKVAINYINKCFPEAELRDAVTPDTPYGCKRGLVSDDFYPSLLLDNVELIKQGLKSVEETSVTLDNDRVLDPDVIIYCTGYRIHDHDRFEVRGKQGQLLSEQMLSAPEAYKGIAKPGFPNYFFSVGPNGLVLNVSYFLSCEKNIETIVRLIKDMKGGGCNSIEAKEDLTESYNQWMTERFPKFSWGHSSCHSYYRSESGQVPFLYPGTYKEYCRSHEACSISDFDLS